MDFEFLPKLPKSDLDDRSFDDLVRECMLRIPRYCPEWTHYGPSDPGMTLIELFAWMTDEMLKRFNQVPRRNYVAFLELLGVRLLPPKPAQTEVTFYLSAALPENYRIPGDIEVATLRTENEEEIIFSTDAPLTIGNPRIKFFLTARTAETEPGALRDSFLGFWTEQANEEWSGPELAVFEQSPQPGNCFYLVFEPERSPEGNVIAVTFRGEAATSTGINPDMPPRQWQAWNGSFWESVLLQETDDRTQGFSFSELVRLEGNPLSGADVILHLPLHWPETQFASYNGCWLRCAIAPASRGQSGYNSSPRIVGISVRSIGGTVRATQSAAVRNEVLGESDGTPGQTFQLQAAPILPRQEGEYILVSPPSGLPQIWQEVNDFADSGPSDLHYTLDSIAGRIQFGPLIREPGQLLQQTNLRENGGATPETAQQLQAMERQYGAVPARGAQIMMAAYRTGGGQKGNVQKGTIQVLKSAVPYVARVTNHKPARNGADAESLEDAAIRVPRMLRTRDRAVTAEDFETLAVQAGGGAVARVRCLSPTKQEDAGTMRLILVPNVNLEAVERGEGIDPSSLALSDSLTQQVLAYLDERRLLGVRVLCETPQYVGVAVQTEVALDPELQNPVAQQEILAKMQVALYRFLNPIVGGPEGDGWPFGRPVYPSDIVTILQGISGVRYLGAVQLFELRSQGETWVRRLPRDPIIDPGSLGLVCSWRSDRLRSGHVISLI